MNKDYENGINMLKQMTDENGEQMINSVGEIFPDFLDKMIFFWVWSNICKTKFGFKNKRNCNNNCPYNTRRI